MRKTIKIILITMVFCLSYSVKAQLQVNAGTSLGFPVGDFSDSNIPGTGVSLGVGKFVNNNVLLSGDIDYLFFHDRGGCEDLGCGGSETILVPVNFNATFYDNSDEKISMYLTIGVGGAYFYSGNTGSLDFSLTQKIGLIYRITDSWGLDLNFGLNGIVNFRGDGGQLYSKLNLRGVYKL